MWGRTPRRRPPKRERQPEIDMPRSPRKPESRAELGEIQKAYFTASIEDTSEATNGISEQIEDVFMEVFSNRDK